MPTIKLGIIYLFLINLFSYNSNNKNIFDEWGYKQIEHKHNLLNSKPNCLVALGIDSGKDWSESKQNAIVKSRKKLTEAKGMWVESVQVLLNTHEFFNNPRLERSVEILSELRYKEKDLNYYIMDSIQYQGTFFHSVIVTLDLNKIPDYIELNKYDVIKQLSKDF